MKRLILGALFVLAVSASASEEEYARNREVRIKPDAYSITADYPEPHGRTTVTVTARRTNGATHLTSLVFVSKSVSISIPTTLTDDLIAPQLDKIELTYSSGMRAGEGLYASVTVPWGYAFTNCTHLYQKRTYCIVGGRLAYLINKRPKGNWYETELKKIEDTQPAGRAYGSPEAGSPPAHP
ncbi:MAG TPA: hypothetical protein PKW49_12685 [Paludibacteraceae bacterium]|jgi:hypothetical protein|nr:hypothetical protein [Paludibacteraceae bacterium]